MNELVQPLDLCRAAFSLIIVCGLCWGIWLCYTAAVPISTNTTYVITNTSIVSLNDGSLTSGSFLLGSGHLNQETMYFYYEGSADVYRLKHVRTDYATVNTDENDHPYITKIVAIECRTYKDSSYCGEVYDWSPVTYEFHVPKGTITKNNFNLDGRV